MAKVSVTATYEVTYCVICYEGTEGGMDVHHFGEDVPELQQALNMLDLAIIKEPHHDWCIQLDVTKTLAK